jgi:hypothetical protein
MGKPTFSLLGEAPMSQHFLDVAAKHKQVNHVAKYVPEIDMQELIWRTGSIITTLQEILAGRQ